MSNSPRYQLQNQLSGLRKLPFFALREALREGYGAAQLKNDVLAGMVVGVVALPLSMALSIAVGAPPQNGLYTAIVAGLIVSLLGGSRTNATGPTAAFIVILAPIYVKFGLGGLLVAGIMGGLILLLMGLLRLGRLIQYVPHPVTTGFTAGIAVVIATLQLKDFLGLTLHSSPDAYLERVKVMFEARGTAQWPEFAIGALSLALLIVVPKLTSRIPGPLIALPLAAVVAAIAHHFIPSFDFASIASRFHTTLSDGTVVPGIPRLPPMPILPWDAVGPGGVKLSLSYEMIRSLIPGAFAIAMLGAIESLLCAVVADGMARTKHDPDAELIALGVGNIVAPFFGGIPATGALARTATGIRSGSRSPVSCMVHAVTVLAAVLVLAPVIGYLPMSSLAALLLIVAWNMSDRKHFAHIVRLAPRSDVVVLLICFTLTVVFDMVVSVTVGIMLAALLFMRRMVEVSDTRLENESANLHRPLPRGVMLYDINGPLFFGAAERAMGALGAIKAHVRVVILTLEDVPAIDATGLVGLESALEGLQKIRCQALLVGLRPQPRAALEKARLSERFPNARVVEGLDAAISAAEAMVQAESSSGQSSQQPATPTAHPA